LYDQLDKAALTGDVDQTARIFADMKGRYTATAFTRAGGLATAKLQFDKGKADTRWPRSPGSRAMPPRSSTDDREAARGRRPARSEEVRRGADAPRTRSRLKDGAAEFGALVDDRRGDVLMAQGKTEDAKAAYTKAWKAMDDKVEYRRLIEAKLTALGATPDAAKQGTTP
jgi:hypothetical protein